MTKLKKSILNLSLLVFGLILSFTQAEAQSADEALKQLDNEKNEAAMSTIKAAIAKDGGNATNYYYAGYIYLNLDKADSAKMFFDKGVSTDAKEPLNYVGQGYIALNNGKAQEAQGLFDKAIDLSKGKDAVVYNKIADALVHADTKDANKALSYLNKALGLKKKKDEAQINAETHLLMGDAYLALKDGGKAITSYERAASADNKVAAKAYVKIGKIYLIPRNYEAAQSEFDKAVAADPNYAPVYKELGELYFIKRDINKAKEMYSKYMELSDVKRGSRSRYAIFIYLTRDYPAAITELKQALTVEPDNIVLHRLLGYSLYQTGDFQGAKASMDKYFSLVKPDKTIAADYENYGKILMNLGEDSLAVENFYVAIEKDTANFEMVEQVAEELRGAKKYEEAAKMYDLLLEKKKDASTNEFYRAANAYMGAKQYEKADTYYQKVIDATPDNHLGYVALATSKFYQDPDGSKGLAREPYQKVIELLEADSTTATERSKKSALITAYQYMASYYTQKEDLKSAGDYWAKVETIDPGNANAKRFKEYLIEVEKYKKAQQQQQKKSASK